MEVNGLIMDRYGLEGGLLRAWMYRENCSLLSTSNDGMRHADCSSEDARSCDGDIGDRLEVLLYSNDRSR